jgi:hypothetical protein
MAVNYLGIFGRFRNGLWGWTVWVRFLAEKNLLFPSPQRPDKFWGQTRLLFNWYRRWGLSSKPKGLGREADHSLPSSAEVKNGGVIPIFPLLPICLHGKVLN